MREKAAPESAGRNEFDLLLRCAGGGFDAEQIQATDGRRLLEAARRHGVLPLLLKNGREALTGEALEDAESAVRESGQRGLHLAAELVRLMSVFQDNDLAVAPYKGPVLAAELYGNLALRNFCDLDLLIARDDLEKAEKLLRDEGYTPEIELSESERDAWLAENCELNFNSPDGLCHVELHWAPLPPRFGVVIDMSEMLTRVRTVSVSGKPVPSLAPEDMLIVLCAHGFKHFWTRLFWIVDLAKLLTVHPDIDWKQVLDRAQRWRCRRMVLLGLVLANELLDASLPDEIGKAVAGDRVVEKLKRKSKEWLLLGADAPRSLWAEATYALSGGERFRDRWPMWRYLFRRTFAPNEKDRSSLKLPKGLSLIYWLIRPFRLVRDYGFRPPKRRT